MSEPLRITAWVCDSCPHYWRTEKSTGIHMATNPSDPNGRLIRHTLRKATFVEDKS